MSGVFELFKIGIGPSSSHTMGPMQAARDMIGFVRTNAAGAQADRISCELLGSLSATGRGHGTDLAILVGLRGAQPDTVTAAEFDAARAAMTGGMTLDLGGAEPVAFVPKRDLVFARGRAHAYHPNAMVFRLWHQGEEVLARTFFSVGGGFVECEDETAGTNDVPADEPYPFRTAAELIDICARENRDIADIVLANETASSSAEAVRAHLARIWEAMQQSITDGLAGVGMLPGPMQVRRRAADIHRRLVAAEAETSNRNPDESEWVSLWAIAVNETNAGFGRIVTAPTNGAAGIVPAVLSYYHRFIAGASDEGTETFLLTAAAFGGLLKLNASISGADVGCQGEVGSAAAMAAAGLAACLGGTPSQIENAAEIALEHHLGMTCDPIGGLVQIPCIERNAMAANKAISAARLSLLGDGTHYVSFDQATNTMLQTGRDMKRKYKETSKGGLAVNVPLC